MTVSKLFWPSRSSFPGARSSLCAIVVRHIPDELKLHDEIADSAFTAKGLRAQISLNTGRRSHRRIVRRVSMKRVLSFALACIVCVCVLIATEQRAMAMYV